MSDPIRFLSTVSASLVCSATFSLLLSHSRGRDACISPRPASPFRFDPRGRVCVGKWCLLYMYPLPASTAQATSTASEAILFVLASGPNGTDSHRLLHQHQPASNPKVLIRRLLLTSPPSAHFQIRGRPHSLDPQFLASSPPSFAPAVIPPCRALVLLIPLFAVLPHPPPLPAPVAAPLLPPTSHSFFHLITHLHRPRRLSCHPPLYRLPHFFCRFMSASAPLSRS